MSEQSTAEVADGADHPHDAWLKHVAYEDGHRRGFNAGWNAYVDTMKRALRAAELNRARDAALEALRKTG